MSEFKTFYIKTRELVSVERIRTISARCADDIEYNSQILAAEIVETKDLTRPEVTRVIAVSDDFNKTKYA